MAVFLIRHGETDLNAARVVQHPHTPLGETGQQQARRLGARLAQHRITCILSSDYTRARMTADCVATVCGVEPLECIDLRERNFGDLRGTAYDELGELDIFAPDYQPPAGENGSQFDARVDRAWDEIVRHASAIDGDLAVVTHGLVLRSLFERKLDLGTRRIEPELVVANTSVTEIEHAPPWRLLTLACIAHLDGDVRAGGAV